MQPTDVFSDKDYPEPRYTQDMDQNPLELKIIDFCETVEVTDYGKLQLQLARDAVVEAKAYNGLELKDGNLYHDVAKEGYYRGMLTMIDLIADHIKVPTTSDNS